MIMKTKELNNWSIKGILQTTYAFLVHLFRHLTDTEIIYYGQGD